MTNRRIEELLRREGDGAPIYDVRYWSIERWFAVIAAILAVTGFYWRMQALEQRVADNIAVTTSQIIELRRDMKEEIAKLQTRELAEELRREMQTQLDNNAHRIDSIDTEVHNGSRR